MSSTRCEYQTIVFHLVHEYTNTNSVLTTQKLVSFASNFSIPVHTTTQTTAKLGPTVPSLASQLPSPPHDKTKFSMAIPSILSLLPAESSVALVGIESHICITQTALELRDQGHHVYVMADGVSSCNATEVRIALERLRGEKGVTVTSSESWMYEVVGDSSHAGFKELIGVVKEKAGDTREALKALPPKI